MSPRQRDFHSAEVAKPINPLSGWLISDNVEKGRSMMASLRRVANLLIAPVAEWTVIDREEVTPTRLALTYVAPLALIPTAAIVVALALLGVQAGGQLHRAPLLDVSISALLFFVLTVGAVFLFALVVDWLSPRFGGTRNYRQAFKVSAYSITAAMVAGILAMAPALQIFSLLGATYSLYLLFLGAPRLMHPPEKSAINFSIVTTLAAILLALIVGLIAMLAAAPSGNLFPGLPRLSLFDPAAPSTSNAPVSSSSPGVLSPGAPGIVLGSDLRGAAPQTLAGINRVSVGFERQGVAGQRTIRLEAEYRGGPKHLSLQIVYSPSIAQAIGFGGPATSEYARETADGYSRRMRVDGAIISSEWDVASKTGSYARLAEDRLYVRVSGGGGVTAEEMKAAVELFGRETLAQFAAES